MTDASAPTCRVLRGPIELPLRAPATLVVRGDMIDTVLNEDGKPRVLSFPAGPVLGLREAVVLPAGAGSQRTPERTAGLAVPCAVAGERVFCTDHGGAVHRATRAVTEDHIVASARSTSRIAAATLGGAHVALAYLASRQTSEGWVS
ncbi:MAG: hypothetical protein M3O46_06135, partial [Myxococcota bacterium]|nr:hypothetical protein [Myxococcota bacterium]